VVEGRGRSRQELVDALARGEVEPGSQVGLAMQAAIASLAADESPAKTRRLSMIALVISGVAATASVAAVVVPLL
jgi:hypothetical protein